MLYIFDVDGTLIRSFMREGDAEHDYDDVELLPGRYGKLNDLKARPGTRFAIASNQGGVAFGYQTEAQVRAKMARVIAELGMWDVPLTLHVAFNHPNAKLAGYKRDDGMRKPGPGMLLLASRVHGVPHPECVYVGDMETDQQAAIAAGIPYVDQGAFF